MEIKPLKRPSKKVIEGFRSIATSTLGDILDSIGVETVISGLKPVKQGMVLVGPAVTVKEVSGVLGTYSIEDFKISKVIDFAEAGDILVFDNSGKEVSTWGGLASTAAKVKDIGGAVIDGGCRDIDQIVESNLPVFAKYFTPKSAKTRIKILELNGTIQCCGIRVKGGDIIVADWTGIIVIPKEKAEDVLEKAAEAEKVEAHFMEELRRGKTFGDIQKITGRL